MEAFSKHVFSSIHSRALGKSGTSYIHRFPVT